MAGRDGFTLIEVLVAFVLLAVVTVAVQNAIGVTLGSGARAADRTRAELVARNLMSAPLGPGTGVPAPMNGDMDGYDWSLSFTPVDLPTTTATGEPAAWMPVRMIVTVTGRSQRSRPLRLETIRLARTGG
ncbi:prepilin-type N-terminal cleavage/methylation domain-containing protein [Ensifer soli]|uniref:prepilin-type N-terminal cleavage/methylation domain-containing protein n=1 Tax=Ciceribacter sp. sgz301302 TaxID=3342379 RepID=UPI0035BB95F9